MRLYLTAEGQIMTPPPYLSKAFWRSPYSWCAGRKDDREQERHAAYRQGLLLPCYPMSRSATESRFEYVPVGDLLVLRRSIKDRRDVAQLGIVDEAVDAPQQAIRGT